MATSSAEETGAIYFWREYNSPYSYLSQWYHSPFHLPPTELYDSTTIQTAEQYMMHRKALLFYDYPIAAQILKTTSPKTQKALGRQVKRFNQATWERHREKIVEEGTYLKFKYGVDCGELRNEGLSLKERLLRTGDRELVEASPMDRIWGIGFGAKRAEEMRQNWGLNLLGKALMKVRDRLRAEEKGREVEVDEHVVIEDGKAECTSANKTGEQEMSDVKPTSVVGEDIERTSKKVKRV